MKYFTLFWLLAIPFIVSSQTITGNKFLLKYGSTTVGSWTTGLSGAAFNNKNTKPVLYGGTVNTKLFAAGLDRFSILHNDTYLRDHNLKRVLSSNGNNTDLSAKGRLRVLLRTGYTSLRNQYGKNVFYAHGSATNLYVNGSGKLLLNNSFNKLRAPNNSDGLTVTNTSTKLFLAGAEGLSMEKDEFNRLTVGLGKTSNGYKPISTNIHNEPVLRGSQGDGWVNIQAADSRDRNAVLRFDIPDRDNWFMGINNTDGKHFVIDKGNLRFMAINNNGTTSFKEIQLQPSVVPDYVFEEDYELKSLREVEEYIEKEGHLPGIPSAQEIMDQDGYFQSEMTMKLLEKIEELTLHAIAQQKEIDALKSKNQ